jgi:hypothetical protein
MDGYPFWHPRSGPLGGIICLLIVLGVDALLLLFNAPPSAFLCVAILTVVYAIGAVIWTVSRRARL